MFFYAYTDGSCLGNPGPGAWSVWIAAQDQAFERCPSISASVRQQDYFSAAPQDAWWATESQKAFCGYEPNTTNNRMELQGAIQALRSLPNASYVALVTDSQYVAKGIQQWIQQWKCKGWRTAAKQPVKNEDLWKELDHHAQRLTITWLWVRGHADDPHNNFVDALARNYAAQKQ